MSDRNRRLNRLEGQIPEPEEPEWNLSNLSDAELYELIDLTEKVDGDAALTCEEEERLQQLDARCTETAKNQTRIEIYSPGPDGPTLKRRVSVPIGAPVVRPYAHLSDEELKRAICEAETRMGKRIPCAGQIAGVRNSSEEQRS